MKDPSELVSRVANSGNPELDRNIRIECNTLNRFFLVEPDFAFFDDAETPQAKTINRERPSRYAAVFIGTELVRQEKRLNPLNWQSAIIGILAHEWAHVYQYRASMVDKTYVTETHADFLAGWYLGSKNATGQVTIHRDAFARSLFSKPTRGFFSIDDYGPPETRVAAMVEGFAFGERQMRRDHVPDVWAAAEEGYNYVGKTIR